MTFNKTTLVKVSIATIVSLGVGALSGLATASSVTTWYTTLNKPFFNPPNWLFAPVWTLLYAMMGLAAGLVWASTDASKSRNTALVVFGVQLLLNSLWSILFFGLRNPTLALVEIILLWAAIAFTIKKFRPINSTAAWLLVPYLLWVTFASILNTAIVILN